MRSIDKRLKVLDDKIKEPDFREKKGMANEVGYYVFDYPEEQELEVRERVKKLASKYNRDIHGFEIVVFDLYDIIIDFLEDQGFLEICEEFEKTKGFSEIIKAVNEMLRMEEDNQDNVLISYIYNNTPEDSIIFLVGVGKCYPMLRSHKVLNNLHQHIDDVPVIMFFPGKYDGQKLMLFSELKDDNYYRAFEIV